MSDETFQAGRGLRDEGRVGEFKQMWSGARFYPLDPRPEDVNILDLAMGLGNMARYSGQTRFYSVAEHLILCSRIVPEPYALEALLHDAPEVIMADLSRPVRRSMRRTDSYFEMEEGIWKKAIAAKWNLRRELSEVVLKADVQILALEKEALLPRSDEWYLPFPAPDDPEVVIQCLKPPKIQFAFIDRYAEITGEDQLTLRIAMHNLMMEDLTAFLRARNKRRNPQ